MTKEPPNNPQGLTKRLFTTKAKDFFSLMTTANAVGGAKGGSLPRLETYRFSIHPTSQSSRKAFHHQKITLILKSNCKNKWLRKSGLSNNSDIHNSYKKMDETFSNTSSCLQSQDNVPRNGLIKAQHSECPRWLALRHNDSQHES